jgi:hypothetical protein
VDGERIRAAVGRLCREYADRAAGELLVEGREWQGRIGDRPGPELVATAGWLALLVGCVEYDLGLAEAAEASRRKALAWGTEVGADEIVGWAYEMAAWFALTRDDPRAAIAAADGGLAVAGNYSVAAQLAAQKARAWAKLADRRQVGLALEQARAVPLDITDPGNHFVVDPGKIGFFAMDCYRIVGADELAEACAHEVLRAGTEADGPERSPMRNAQARLTLGILAARRGDTDTAARYGAQALTGPRRSRPELRAGGRELGGLLRDSSTPAVRRYLALLKELEEVVP